MEPMLGFNTKQWWVWDGQRGCFVDPPIVVLDELEKYEDIDEQSDRLWEICNEYPDWLYDEEYCYYDEDFEI